MDQPSYQPLTETQEKQIPLSTDPWDSSRAASIAVQNHEKGEQFLRTANHINRWNTSDQLYLAWSPQKFWEGTRVPRASVSVPLIFEQVESLLPNDIKGIFPLRDNLEIIPRPGTTMDQARAVNDLLLYQMDCLGDDGATSLREIYRRAKKSAFIYGNGIVEVTWEEFYTDTVVYYVENVPIPATIPHPVTGEPVQVPSGQFQRVPRQKIVKKYTCRPRINEINLRDFVIDPNCKSPNIQDARFCSVRNLMTVAELRRYRGQPGFDIPDDATLVDLARGKTGQYQDQQKQAAEVYRNSWWQPQNDYSANSDTWRVEVIRYFEKDRCVWMLNRSKVCYNRANPYGFLPFINAFYIDVPNRFYGLSLSDVLEGEQRTQTSILQGRLDELALMIHSPWLKRRGIGLSQNAMRMSPGRIIEVGDNPAEDLVRAKWDNSSQSAFVETEASERRAQKITGITDLVALGTPSTGGNSANRTATGINTQAAATGTRIQYLVENSEDTFIVPLMQMVFELNKRYLPADLLQQVLGPEGRDIVLNPLDVKNANVQFSMKGSDKMRSRQMLLTMLPQLLPVILNPQLGQMLAQVGMMPDLKQIMLQVTDAMGVAPQSWFRTMTPQEQAQQQQAQMMPEMAQMAMQQQRLDKMHQMQEDKGDTEIAKTFVSGLLTPEAGAGLLASNGMDMPLKMLEEKNKPKPVAPKKK